MIRVQVEVIPFGVHEEAKIIGQISVCNTGENPSQKGTHQYAVFLNGSQLGYVNHRRGQKKGAFKLVKKALELVK